MKKSLLTALLLLVATQLLASRQQTIDGRVTDQTGNGVAFATIVLLAETDQVAGTTSDESGQFALTAPHGHYTLKVQHLNYEEYSKEVEIDGSNSLGTIVLSASSNEIEEVVVKGQLVRREADRFVVDVAASVASVGKDGVELLERAPGVWVDDEKIAINGRNGAKVYINDIELKMSGEQLINYIKTLRAEEIQKIEVIPVSGADYDADSASGIIKITLRRQRENGTQGSVQHHTTWNDMGLANNPSANIALHSGRVDLNAAAWFTDRDDEATAKEHTHYFTNQSELNSQSALESSYREWGGRLDAVIALHKRHTIGFGGRYHTYDDTNDNHSQSHLQSPTEQEQIESHFLGKGHLNNVTGTFNYIWKIDTLGSTLKVLADYQVRSNCNDNDNHSIVNTRDSLYRDRTDIKYRIGSAQIALEKHFTPQIVMQAGGKYTRYQMRSDALYEYHKEAAWHTNHHESFHINYTEQIAAAYGTLRAQFGRWGFVAGLRGEYTRTESDGTKLGKDYFSLFPNLNLSYNLHPSGKHLLIAQYARNISRPGFWALNPQRQQISDYSYQIGNPSLDPSFGNSIDLTLVMWHKYTLSAGLNIQTDEIQQTFENDPNDPNVIYITHINYKDTKQYYINLNTPLQLTKWWEANANLTYVLWEQQVAVGSPTRLRHFLSTYASTTFSLPAKFYIDLSWSYHNRISMGNAVIGSNHTVNGSLKKRFGDRFTATFSVKNIFDTQQDIGATNNEFSRTYELEQFYNARQFRVGLTWHFKSGKAFRAQKLENSDDSNRL